MAHQILQERHGHYGLRTLPSLTDLEGVEVWSEHEHPGVEAVRPAGVGSSGELFLVKELRFHKKGIDHVDSTVFITELREPSFLVKEVYGT